MNSLTNLERVLTTPIPFSYVPNLFFQIDISLIEILSYAFHLWSVTTLYCLALVRFSLALKVII